MSNSLEATGIIHSIGQTTEYGQNGFTKREFVIKLTGEHESEEYPSFVAFELIKDKCSIMDTYQQGMTIKVLFNLQGRLWQAEGKPEKCFNALQAWKVDNLTASAPQQAAPQYQPQAAPQQQYAPAPQAPQQAAPQQQYQHQAPQYQQAPAPQQNQQAPAQNLNEPPF